MKEGLNVGPASVSRGLLDYPLRLNYLGNES